MRKAFSLVELSIVLVILGLLVGGILAGQSLIRASELRAVGTEYQRWQTANAAFRDKYFALAGDMANATSFWGRQNSNADCVTNGAASVSATGTCDGSGNGFLFPAGGAAQSGEYFQFWRQLALAGLIEGAYGGLAGSAGGQHAVPGSNSPASKLGGAGWGIQHNANFVGDAAAYASDLTNALIFGTPYAASNNPPFSPALTPAEAWNIDTKNDDGKPGSGKIIVRYWNFSCATASSATDYASPYNLSVDAKLCSFYFPRALY